MKLKTFYLLLLLFAFDQSRAQVKYFAEAGGNLSILSKTKNSNIYTGIADDNPVFIKTSVTSTYEKKFGYHVKGGAQIPLTTKFFIEPALHFSYLRFRKKTNMEYTARSQNNFSTELNLNDSYYSVGSYSGYGDPLLLPGNHILTEITPTTFEPGNNTQNLGKSNFMILSLQLNAKYSVGAKTHIGLGMAPYLLLHTQTYRNELLALPQTSAYSYRIIDNKDNSKTGYNDFGLSANLFAEQNITKNISLVASGTQYITRLYNNDAPILPDKKSRMRHVNFGIRYYFN